MTSASESDFNDEQIDIKDHFAVLQRKLVDVLGVVKDFSSFNTGGYISGQKGIDMVPAMLTHGEFVINATATQKFLPLLEKINSGKIQSFASGGVVSEADALKNEIAYEDAMRVNMQGVDYKDDLYSYNEGMKQSKFFRKMRVDTDEAERRFSSGPTKALYEGGHFDNTDSLPKLQGDELKIVESSISNFLKEKFKLGEDMTQYTPEKIYDEINDETQELVKAFKQLQTSMQSQIDIENKFQGIGLKKNEVAGESPERKQAVTDAIKIQNESLKILENKNVLGEGFNLDDFKLDEFKKNLIKDLPDYTTNQKALIESIKAFESETELRNLIESTYSKVDTTRMAQSANEVEELTFRRLIQNPNDTPNFLNSRLNDSQRDIDKRKNDGYVAGTHSLLGQSIISNQQAKGNVPMFDQTKSGSFYERLGGREQNYDDLIKSDQSSKVSKEVQDNLKEIFSNITATFNLARGSIKDSLDSISEYAINSKKELDDLFQKGGFSDVNIKDKIKELDEQILEAHAVNSSTIDSLSFLSNIKTDSFGTETFDSFVNSITNTGSEEQNAMALAEKVNNMTNNMNAKQNITSQLQTSITNSEKLNNIKMSTGGFVSGPMGKDVIPAMLTDGEFVIRADVAKNWRGFLEYLNETGHLGMYTGGPVKLAAGGAPGGGGGGGGGVPPGSPGGGIPSIESQQADLLKYNSELMSQERIYTELVMYSKELAESGESAVSIQEKLNAKKEILLNQLREEEELSHATLRELTDQRDLLIAMDHFKLSGFYDGLIGTFDAVEQKIEGILNSVPFVGSLLATSLKTVTGPVFDELRGGFKTGFKAAADELKEQMGGVNEDGSLKPFDPDKLEVDKLMDAFTGKFSEAMTNAKNMLQGAIGLAKAFGPALLTVALPLVIIGGLLAMAVSRFFELEEQAEEFRKGLGLMASTAKPIENIAREIQTEFALAGVELETAFNAATALTSQLGTTHLVTKDAVKTIALMEAGLGISAETAAGALDTFKNMGDSSGASAENMMMATAALADAAGVPLDAVMSDIANASEDTMKFMKGNAKEMMLAAVQARRLGVSMDSITGAMSKALDIESSITDEMRLASMMGQHISLDAMRRASFEGDAEQVMQEQLKALKQMGGTDAMNPYQLEAAANALGLSVDEMVKMERHEKGLQDLKNGTAEQQAMYNKYTEMQNKLQEEGVKSAAEEAEERIKQQQAELVKANIMRQVNAIMTKLAETLLPMVEAGFKILMPILNSIFFVLGLVTDVVGFLLLPITLLADGISYVADEFGGVAKVIGTVAALLVGLPLLIGAFGGTVSGVLTTLKTGILSVGSFIKKAFTPDGLSALKDSMSSMFSAGLEGAKGLGGALLNAVKNPMDTVKSIGDSLADLGAKGKDMMSDMFSGGDEDGGMLDKIKGMFGGRDGPEEAASPSIPDISDDAIPDVDPAKGDRFKDLIEKFNSIDMKKVIQAAAAILILSGALFVSAKAFQEFSEVSWEGVAKGIIGLTALVVAAKFLEKGSTSMVKGAVAIGILGLALLPAALAFQMFSDVSWGGVLAGMIALGALAVVAMVLGNLIVPIAMGAAAIALLGIALIPFGVAAVFAGVGALMIASAFSIMVDALKMLEVGDIANIALLVGTFSLMGVMLPLIILGAGALTIMGAALLTFSVMAVLASFGIGVLAISMAILAQSFEAIGITGALVLASLATIAVFAPMFFVAAAGMIALAGASFILGFALPALGVGAMFAGYGIAILAAGVSTLEKSLSNITTEGLAILLSLGAIGLLAPMFFVATGGILMLAGAIAVMSAALLGASVLSMFSSDDPFAMYINLGQNADKLNEASKGLKNISSALSALDGVDAEDILEDIADGMEDLFDEIEDIDPEAITKFTTVGVSFKYIGDGMDSIKKGISPFKDLLTLLNDPANFEGAIIGLNALTSAMYDLCKVMELIGEKDISILQQTTQPGAITGDLTSTTVPVDTTVLAEGSNAEGAPSAEQMAQGGAGAPATAMAEVVQQVASVPAVTATGGGGSESSAGVEAKLDELIELMKSGKIGVNLDGKKVESTLAKAAP
nr:minor tail protein gp26 family protein [uncultured Mediterranean phage uvMED]